MIQFFVRHATTVMLLVFSLFVFGLWSYQTLPREASPDVQIPFVMVTTPYAGVAPEDIENLIVIPLENELSGVRDLRRMTGVASEGAGHVYLEFEPDVAIEDVLQRVRDRVSRARPDLPSDADEPIVRELSFSDIPVLIVTIAGDLDEEALKDLATDLQDDVLRLNGVLEARLTGGLLRQVRVYVDPVRLSHYGLSMDDLASAIRNENANIPGGSVTAGEASLLLRVPEHFTTTRAVEEVAIKRVGHRPVFVRDVARVVDGYEDRTSYARMNGRPAISLAVTKRAGANILDIGDETKALVERHRATWPEGVEVRVLADQSENIRGMVKELESNILTALFLVMGVILFAMGIRNSLFVALAIPLSMLISFVVIQAVGFTLNMIVLFALILALGMLVDNAIVVVENIYRHMEEGKDRIQAAIDGTREVAGAVTASTATTVAAFLPLVFWEGIMGAFMGYLPKTLVITLVASLLVAVCILPVAASRLMKPAPRSVVESPREGLVMRAYRATLQRALHHRYLTAAAGFLLLLFTFGVYGAFNHGSEFFPDTEPDRATIAVRAPEGTDLETTDRIVRQIEALLAAEPNVDIYVAETGVTGGGLGGARSSPHGARLTVDFLPHRNRAERGERSRVEPTRDTVVRLRGQLEQLTGAQITIQNEQMGPPVGAPIEVQVVGDDFHALGAEAQRLRRALEAMPELTDLEDDYRVGRPELRLRIDRGAATRIGVSTGEIGNAIRTAVAGQRATTLREGTTELDVVVQLAPEYRANLQDVLQLRLPGREVRSPDTWPVPLSAVARYELEGGTGAISRIDQERVVKVTGEVIEGANVNQVRSQQVGDLLQTWPAPDGIHLRIGGANEEMERASAFLSRAFAIGVALILLVLVTQFDSLAMPAIILASVIMSLVGVLWGLLFTFTSFGVIMTGLGVISLAGVVVNNAIVLLDYVEQLRARGMTWHEAVVRAGMVRFRPVVLTAITTVLGLLPMALGVSVELQGWRPRLLIGGPSAEWWGPMAVAVIFGLSFATVLTLVFVPVMYALREDLVWAWSRLGAWRGRAAVGTAAKLLLAGVGLGLAAPAQALTLEDALRAAEGHNLDLAVAREQTRQAESLRGQAWALLSPRVIAQGGYTINEYAIELDPSAFIPEGMEGFFPGDGDPMVIQERTYLSGNVTVQQPLFNASALPTLKGAYRLTGAARGDEASQRQRIRAGVARAYYGLYTAREAAALSEGVVQTAIAQLELAARQVEVGLAPRRAELQARLALSQAERDLQAARENLVAAEESFHRLTGLPRDAALSLPDTPPIPAELHDALAAVEGRPDVRAAAFRADAGRLQLHAHRLGWLPDLSGRFTWSWTENTGFSDDPTMWMIVLQANWTLWDGGLRAAQDREVASQARVAALAVQRAAQVAEEEVRVAWERYHRAASALAATDQEQALADESLSLARAAFEAGEATWLEVTEAELAQRAARLSALTERMNRDLAAIDLLVAVGRY